MIAVLRETLWKHFGGSIDMLKNAIQLFPKEDWYTDEKFFYMAYHCVIFLDYYLTIPPNHFSSPLPYTLTEQSNIPKDALDDVVPDRIYGKKELLDYLQLSREKCRRFIGKLTAEKLIEPWIYDSPDMNTELSGRDTLSYSVLDILFYNMRHVQHHAAQLNLLLRQKINAAPRWVSQAEDVL